MKVFISWSGEKSREFAMFLRGWLKEVIQVVEPFVSEDDIEKGVGWFAEISKQLQDTTIGIICLTKGNLGSAFLAYETGALAKSVADADTRVSPLLLDLKSTDVVAPYSQHQMTKPTKTDVSRLLKTINKQLAKPIEDDILTKALDRLWPDFEAKLAEVNQVPDDGGRPEARTERELLEEVLEVVRGTQRMASTTPFRSGLRVQPDRTRFAESRIRYSSPPGVHQGQTFENADTLLDEALGYLRGNGVEDYQCILDGRVLIVRTAEPLEIELARRFMTFVNTYGLEVRFEPLAPDSPDLAQQP